MTDKDMILALLAHLADAGVGVFGSSYTASDTGLYYGRIGSQTDRGVALARYGRDDFVPADGFAVRTRRVQAWLRGLPGSASDADDLAESVDAAMQGLRTVAGVNYVVRLSGPNPVGTDGNGRSEITLNYSVTLED